MKRRKPPLSVRGYKQVLENVIEIPSFSAQCRTLLEIRDLLPDALRDEADDALIATLAGHPEEDGQFDLVLSALTRVGRPSARQLFSSVWGVVSDFQLWSIVKELLPKLAGDEELGRDLAEAVFEKPELQAKAWSVSLLAPYLSEESLRKAVRLAVDLPDWLTRELPSLLASIAHRLPPDVIPEAFGLLKRLSHDRDLSVCLQSFIPNLNLTDSLLAEALKLTKNCTGADFTRGH